METKLKIAETVFDGYKKVPVSIAPKFYKDGEWVDSDPEGLVAGVGDSSIDEPKTSLYWNVEHGNTGWMRTPHSPGKMTNGTVYLVERQWYEEIEAQADK